MRVAVLGSGPGAMYTIKYFLKHHITSPPLIHIFEKLHKPFGLVRYGVAPDHSEVKEVANEFASLVRDHSTNMRLYADNELIGKGSIDRLRRVYDAVLIATGAQGAKRMPFSNLPSNTMSARDFVLWYNGHPDFVSLTLPEKARHISVVGHGNVALDVARILSKSPSELEPLVTSGLLAQPAYEWLLSRQRLSGVKIVNVIGRRGYMEAAFTNKEFRELTTLDDASCVIDEHELEGSLSDLQQRCTGSRGKSRGLSIIAKCLNPEAERKSNIIRLRFNSRPTGYIGSPASGLEIEHRDKSNEIVSCDLGIESIGFKVQDEWGLPIDPLTGGIQHDGKGRVMGFPHVYVAGWAKRGPKGVIAANIPCCAETADAIFYDLSSQSDFKTTEVPNWGNPYSF